MSPLAGTVDAIWEIVVNPAMNGVPLAPARDGASAVMAATATAAVQTARRLRRTLIPALPSGAFPGPSATHTWGVTSRAQSRWLDGEHLDVAVAHPRWHPGKWRG